MSKTKKIISLLLSVIMIMSVFNIVPFSVSAAEAEVAATAETEGDFEYDVLDDDTAEITKYKGEGGDITIPSILGGYTVTSIGWYAFEDCTGLKSVTIPDSVTSIGNRAFKDNTDMTSIDIPDSVTSIGERAFFGCTGLTSVTIPDSVTRIAGSAFSNCTGLTSVTIGNSVTSIGWDVFKGCTGIKSVTLSQYAVNNFIDIFGYSHRTIENIVLSDSVTSIGSYAFDGCSSLTSIEIPGSVKKISINPFIGCSEMASIKVDPDNIWYDSRGDCNAIIDTSTEELISGCSVTVIPDSVTSIGRYAFQGCTSLTSIDIPDSVTSIGEGAFNGCTGLTSVDIPDSVTSIGIEAFSICTGLTSIDIPDSVTSIGNGTFRGCTGLTSIDIPYSITSIGNWAFYGCTGLTSIDIPDSVTRSIGERAFSSCTGLTMITIPDSVKGIGTRAFSNCTGLTSVYIPDSVTFINPYAFKDCTKLKSIVIPAAVTFISDHAFDGCDGLVVYGYEGSYAEEFARNKCFDFVKLTSDNDESAGVIAEIPEDSELSAAELTGKQAEAATAGVTDRLNIKAVFDISIKKDGAAVQPDCIVKVQILCEQPDAEVYRKEADGSLTDMNAVYKDGYYVFYTDHFSIYFVATAKGGGMTVSGAITSYIDDTDVTVKLTGVDNNFTAEVKGKSDYSIANVPAGKYTLTVSKDNHVTREYTVTVDNDEVTQDVKLCPKGDVNGDGETDIMDCSVAQRYIRELTTLDDYQIACGDVSGTGDGELDIQDVSRILRHIRELAMLY